MRIGQFSVRVIGRRETSGGYVEMKHNQKYSLSLRNGRSTRCDARVEIDGKHVGTWRIEAGRNIVLERPADDDGMFTFYRAGSKRGAKAGIVNGDPKNGLVVVRFTPEKYIAPIALTWLYIERPQRPWRLDPYPPNLYRPSIAWIQDTFTTGGSSASPGAVTFGDPEMPAKTFRGPISCSGSFELSSELSSEEVDADDYQSGGTGLSGQSDQKFGKAYEIQYDYTQRTTISLRLVAAKKVRRDETRPLVTRGNLTPPPCR